MTMIQSIRSGKIVRDVDVYPDTIRFFLGGGRQFVVEGYEVHQVLNPVLLYIERN